MLRSSAIFRKVICILENREYMSMMKEKLREIQAEVHKKQGIDFYIPESTMLEIAKRVNEVFEDIDPMDINNK